MRKEKCRLLSRGGIPCADRTVIRAGIEAGAVGGQGDGINVAAMALKAADLRQGGEVDQPGGVVPAGDRGDATVGGDGDIHNLVGGVFQPADHLAVL